MFCLVPDAPVRGCLSQLLGQDTRTGRTTCEGTSSPLIADRKQRRRQEGGRDKVSPKGQPSGFYFLQVSLTWECQKPPKVPLGTTEKRLNQDSKGWCRQFHIQTMTLFLAKLLCFHKCQLRKHTFTQVAPAQLQSHWFLKKSI